MNPDLLKVGDRATWQSINRVYSGTVTKVDDRGVHVAVDGGGYMLLGTIRSIQAAAEERKRRIEAHIKNINPIKK